MGHFWICKPILHQYALYPVHCTTIGADTYYTRDLCPSWKVVFSTLVVALRSYPPLWSGSTPKSSGMKDQWSSCTELWFLSVQGRFVHQYLSPATPYTLQINVQLLPFHRASSHCCTFQLAPGSGCGVWSC